MRSGGFESRVAWAALCLVAPCSASCNAVAAGEAIEEPAPQYCAPRELLFHASLRPWDKGFGLGQHDLFDGKPKDTRVTKTVRIHDGLRRLHNDSALTYFDLSEGEVTPVCGVGLYRVTQITARTMQMRRLDHKESMHAPAPRMLAYSVPTNSTQELIGHDFRAMEARVHLENIRTQENGRPAIAKGQVYYQIRTDPLGVTTFGPVEWTVKSGDLLPIRDGALKVLRIVPPDAKLNMRGWMELDPKPVTPAKGRHPKDSFPGPPHAAWQQAEEPH